MELAMKSFVVHVSIKLRGMTFISANRWIGDGDALRAAAEVKDDLVKKLKQDPAIDASVVVDAVHEDSGERLPC